MRRNETSGPIVSRASRDRGRRERPVVFTVITGHQLSRAASGTGALMTSTRSGFPIAYRQEMQEEKLCVRDAWVI